jgi:hypothetical protein
VTKRLTSDEFIVRAGKVHGNTYDYSMCEYVSAKEKVDIICKEHGVFSQTPDGHLQGQGCKVCGIIKNADRTTRTTEQFINESKKIHGDKYGYELVEYVNCMVKVKIICSVHGIFEQMPMKHINSKHGCRKCGLHSANIKRTGVRSPIHSMIQMGEKNHRWNPNRKEAKLRTEVRVKCKSLLRNLLKSLGKSKNDKSKNLLGYSWQDLYEHLSKYNNWHVINNHKWHVDHVFPIKAFLDHGIFEFKIINALDNLQPLLAKDNLTKRDKYDKKEFMQYLLNKYGKQFVESLSC